MAIQALEQMLSSVPRMGQEDRAYQTLDVYTSGLSQMYTGPMGPPGGPMGGNIGQIPSLPSSPINPIVIPYGNQTGLGGDVHDTFKIDRYDNPYGGHTSIKIPGVKPYQINWDK